MKLRFALMVILAAPAAARAGGPSAEILDALHRANAHFMREWPDPGAPIVTNQRRPSNIWTRGVYYEGLMALYRIDHREDEYRYAVRWGEAHGWGLRHGPHTRSADDQCCGQAYLEMYAIDPKPERIAAIRTSLSGMLAGDNNQDWWWIDAVQMALPVFAKLGVVTGDPRYFTKGHRLFLAARDGLGKIPPLFNPRDGLWWRDGTFVPPHVTPHGRQSYWSRGNGWVMAAMARTLDVVPPSAEGRADYVAMLRAMAPAVVAAQRGDGFWNSSLADPNDFGGPESSGTALFTYGLLAGIRLKVLPADGNLAAAEKGWSALAGKALHPDGFLGYVQGTGKQPSEGQPVTYDHKPDFDDFGVGCLLLAGSERYRCSRGR